MGRFKLWNTCISACSSGNEIGQGKVVAGRKVPEPINKCFLNSQKIHTTKRGQWCVSLFGVNRRVGAGPRDKYTTADAADADRTIFSPGGRHLPGSLPPTPYVPINHTRLFQPPRPSIVPRTHPAHSRDPGPLFISILIVIVHPNERRIETTVISYCMSY